MSCTSLYSPSPVVNFESGPTGGLRLLGVSIDGAKYCVRYNDSADQKIEFKKSLYHNPVP